MADVKWIKLTTDMFDNRKIRYLRKLPDGNSIVLIWVMLLTMAGRCNSGGMIFLTENIPYTTKALADELGFEESTVTLALRALEQLGMICTDGFLTIKNWEKYQSTDGMERIREQTRKRVADYRKRQKSLCNVTVTQRNAPDIDIEEDIELNVTDSIKLSDNNKAGNNTDADAVYTIPVNKPDKAAAAENLKSWAEIIGNTWNKTGFTKVRRFPLDSERGRLISKAVGEYGLETVLEVIDRAGKSDFLHDLGTRVTLDWLLKPETFQKCMEGNYDERWRPRSTAGQEATVDRLKRLTEEGRFNE